MTAQGTVEPDWPWCVYCGEPYDPALSDAARPLDYCCADHQYQAFYGEAMRP